MFKLQEPRDAEIEIPFADFRLDGELIIPSKELQTRSRSGLKSTRLRPIDDRTRQVKPSHLEHFVRWFHDLSSDDLAIVGGKNASLGEMSRALKRRKIQIPAGFATTADAYWLFVKENQLEKKIRSELQRFKKDPAALQKVGKAIRQLFLSGQFPEDTEQAIRQFYRQLSRQYGKRDADVAVRSSATAEDLPTASFAGQLESFLNVRGEDALVEACRKCYASLFTDRAISYRENKGFDHMSIALSVGVQKMVRSDKAGAGVIFTLDTETGFPNVVRISAAWGLGEAVVKGMVNADEYTLFKPFLNKGRSILEKVLGAKEKKVIYASREGKTTKEIATSKSERRRFVLTDEEMVRLAKWACVVEEHYRRPMDLEWAKDGETKQLFILQARPETVHSQKRSGVLKTYHLKEKGERLLTGLSVGEAIASGEVRQIHSTADLKSFKPGNVLVAKMTSPDWGPVFKNAKGIVTDLGGRTCHAAIVSRELGIPAVVGTGKATHLLKDGQPITLSCAEGDEGHIYKGLLAYEETEVGLQNLPKTKTKIMINIASPAGSFSWWNLPCDGIGLARIEFLIANMIKVHPMALVHFDKLKDKRARKEIERLTRDFPNKKEYFVHHLAAGIAKIAAPHFPKPVLVRTSDFKSNEYADLMGGSEFETPEANPMLGFRGASRYYHERYRDAFQLECAALKRVRDQFGYDNVQVMIPFCRTLQEADEVLKLMAAHGLKRGRHGLEIYMMAEIPSNVALADKFARRFDGFSIGSNDLTQFVLAVDRDSELLAPLFDERNEAIKRIAAELIRTAHRHRRKVGICGEAPSNYPDFAAFLVQASIDSISVSPARFVEVKRRVAATEKKKR
ncbi:MAG: phosphoenolpyruvate synthase [Verrucomicrobiales bacterium]|nr:phosphoenolpyruvate synthase [Verrucomicrobiales bacterium]